LALLAFAPKVSADDLLKVASPYRGAWETAPPEIGRQAGIFKKHGIVLELVYTRDSDEAEQRVISGSIDVGLGIDAMDALRAYARGDRVRIIGANVTSYQLLVCAEDLANSDHQGSRRQDHRLCY
jgi:NitT/TauT family transport system substrate-binding protein